MAELAPPGGGTDFPPKKSDRVVLETAEVATLSLPENDKKNE